MLPAPGPHRKTAAALAPQDSPPKRLLVPIPSFNTRHESPRSSRRYPDRHDHKIEDGVRRTLTKQALLGAILGRYNADGEARTLLDLCARTAVSLVGVFLKQSERLDYPKILGDAGD